MHISSLEGKNIAILGFGAEGKAALSLLNAQLDMPRITLLEESEHSGLNLSSGLYPNIQLEVKTGVGVFTELTDYDIVIKSPGISPYRPEIHAAIQAGVQFTSGTQLWCDAHSQDRIIIVTGTKGKSTTASLISHLLNKAGRKTELIGNIGTPALECFSTHPAPEFWVMELSSYQATGLKCNPEVAILLNLFPEHTDWHGSTEQYYRDKTGFIGAMKSGFALLNQKSVTVPEGLQSLRNIEYFNSSTNIHTEKNAIYDGQQRLIGVEDFKLPGEHNYSNLCAALSAIKLIGLDPAQLAPHINSFAALPHRLHSLGIRNNVEYIDDSISTTPESALAALTTYSPRPCTMLLGGYDRDLNWKAFARESKTANLKRVITMPDNGDQIEHALRAENPEVSIISTNGLKEAVERAIEYTVEPGVVILSPGAPSYGHFKNYKERGNLFAEYARFSAQE